MKRSIGYIITTVLALVALSSTGYAGSKKIRIAIEGAYPPFSYVSKDGELQGFDVDIAKALCAQMNAECSYISQDWDGIIPGLLTRKYDAIIASMSITEERKKKIAFSDKYYHTPVSFVRKKGSGLEISAEALKGKTVGVQRAGTAHKFIDAEFKDVTVKAYGTQDEVYLDFKNGRLDLIIADTVALLEGFLNTDEGKNYEFVGPKYYNPEHLGEGQGVALRKGEEDLRVAFNKAIKDLRKNGVYQEIQSKYFDFDIYGEEISH